MVRLLQIFRITSSFINVIISLISVFITLLFVFLLIFIWLCTYITFFVFCTSLSSVIFLHHAILVLKGIMNMPDLAVQALALTIRHLKQFGFERILCLGGSFRPFSSNMEMTLSANALQQLEVIDYFLYA